MRLLSRHYDLTATATSIWKLEYVGPLSYVEIALGDHHRHELSLSLETWKSLYEQRWNIYKMLQNKYKDNFISVGSLTVRVCMLNDTSYARTSQFFVRTHYNDQNNATPYVCVWCIDVTFERLDRLVYTVDVKYTRFSNSCPKTLYATSLTSISSSIASYWL